MILAAIVVMVSAAESASAQPFIGFIGAGSTYEGDVLRGQGLMLSGAGLYNYYTAEAFAINTDTMMRLNEYIYQSLKNENREKAARRAARAAEDRENYKKYQERIRNNPEELDVMKGDALNSLRERLASPAIHPSAFRRSPVPLPADVARTIPFFFGPEDAVISMRRLAVTGKRWPIALRETALKEERRAYELALNAALDQQFQGKLSSAAIDRVDQAVNDLDQELDRVFTLRNDRRYIEAKQCIKRLRESKELLKRQKIEQIIGELNKYSGTTVEDLIVFMQRNNLRFHVSEIGDERQMYPKLYAALKQQFDRVKAE
jgi:hypothetical protein